MFCQKCGTQVDDSQAFCPNCGNRVGGAAPQPAAGPTRPARPARPVPTTGPLAKLYQMSQLERIFYLITVCLLPVCFILAMLRVYDPGEAISMATGASWLLVFATIYYTAAIGLVLLEHFGKLSGRWIWVVVACGACAIFVGFTLTWIAGVYISLGSRGAASSTALSVAGWFYFFLQLFLAGASTTLLVLKLSRK